MTTKITKEQYIAELDKLEREYFSVNMHVKDYTTARELLRDSILELMDKLYGKNTEATFEANSGMALQRSIAVTNSWNGAKLEEKLPRDKWLAISVEKRIMDPLKTEMAMKAGKVTVADLEVGKETKETVRLNHKAPSKNVGR